MNTEAIQPKAPFKDRRDAQDFFIGLNDTEINQAMDLSYRDAADVAPEIYYSQAGRAISTEYFGHEGMPTQEVALRAFADLAYIWNKCVTEIRLRFPRKGNVDPTGNQLTVSEYEDRKHLSGTQLELVFATALAGARAGGTEMTARLSSAATDYLAYRAAADLEVETPNADYSLQIKGQHIDQDCLHYDLDKIVIVSLPLFASYLPWPEGSAQERTEEKLTPFKLMIARVASLPEQLADPATAEQAQQLMTDSLAMMQIFGGAMRQYLEDRPDIAEIERIRAEQLEAKIEPTT